VLRRIFGPKREINNKEDEENCIMRSCMRWVGYVVHMRSKRNVYRILVGKPEGKKSPRGPRRRWEYNIKMDISVIG
jgi:hypothetical protein